MRNPVHHLQSAKNDSGQWSTHQTKSSPEICSEDHERRKKRAALCLKTKCLSKTFKLHGRESNADPCDVSSTTFSVTSAMLTNDCVRSKKLLHVPMPAENGDEGMEPWTLAPCQDSTENSGHRHTNAVDSGPSESMVSGHFHSTTY